MKSYTDLEQSKKLAKFLPLESADMFYAEVKTNDNITYPCHILETWGCSSFNEIKNRTSKYLDFIPAWSLAALLGILSKQMYFLDEDGRISLSSYKGNRWNITSINAIDKEPLEADDPLDAAFEMIVWLKENKKI